MDDRQGKDRLGMPGRYSQATYAIVCQENQKRHGRHSAMLRTQVFIYSFNNFLVIITFTMAEKLIILIKSIVFYVITWVLVT